MNFTRIPSTVLTAAALAALATACAVQVTDGPKTANGTSSENTDTRVAATPAVAGPAGASAPTGGALQGGIVAPAGSTSAVNQAGALAPAAPTTSIGSTAVTPSKVVNNVPAAPLAPGPKDASGVTVKVPAAVPSPGAPGVSTSIGAVTTPVAVPAGRVPQVMDADATDRCESDSECGLQAAEVCCHPPSGCSVRPGTNAAYAALQTKMDRDFCPRARVMCLAPNTCAFAAGKTPRVACVAHVCRVVPAQ
jgi:hypothetical protein